MMLMAQAVDWSLQVKAVKVPKLSDSVLLLFSVRGICQIASARHMHLSRSAADRLEACFVQHHGLHGIPLGALGNEKQQSQYIGEKNGRNSGRPARRLLRVARSFKHVLPGIVFNFQIRNACKIDPASDVWFRYGPTRSLASADAKAYDVRLHRYQLDLRRWCRTR